MAPTFTVHLGSEGRQALGQAVVSLPSIVDGDPIRQGPRVHAQGAGRQVP